MYRVFRYTTYPQYWPAESTVYVDAAPGTVEEYVTDTNGTPKLVGNYIGTVTYTNLASFPPTGKVNRLYIDGSTNYLYRWDGSTYVAISSASTGGGIKSGTATQVSAGVYTATITGVSAYTAGEAYLIKFSTVNDGASTLNINSLGAKNIYKNTSLPISSGDIKTNQEVMVVYDGTNFQAIGLVTSQLVAYVHNAEGSTITKGQAVYAYQATGNKMSVKLAKANSDSTSAKTIGLVYDSSISAGGQGYIIIQGVIEGINTNAYSAGDTLYLSGTTFGALTNTKPYAPIHLVYVGIVERANAGNGQIYVKCQNGYELDEIHDVDLISTTPSNNNVLTYVTGSPNLWKAKSIASILGYTPYDAASNPAGYITSSALTPYLTISTAASTYYPLTTNPSGYLSGITSLMVTTALGYTPYNSTTNPAGYITVSALSGYATQSWVTSQGYITTISGISAGGDLTGTYPNPTIASSAVTLSKMANLAANSIIGNNTGSSATPIALTGTQVTAMLDVFTTSVKGLVPFPGALGATYYLDATGSWSVPSGGGGGGVSANDAIAYAIALG